MNAKTYMMMKMEDKSELRCWVCKRNADEVERDLKSLTDQHVWNKVEMSKAIESRDGFGVDDDCEGGEVTRLVETEYTGLPYIPLCLVCQGVFLYQGAVAAAIVIDEQIADRELMPYTEYEIKKKE